MRPMAAERIEIVESIERVERIQRIQRVIRVVSGAPRERSPAVAQVTDIDIDIDIEPRGPGESTAPRGLVLNGVWVPLAR